MIDSDVDDDNRVKCNLTVVNDQEQGLQFVWRGVA